jgi:hypothetical protein
VSRGEGVATGTGAEADCGKKGDAGGEIGTQLLRIGQPLLGTAFMLSDLSMSDSTADGAYASRNVPSGFDPRRLEPLDPVIMEIIRRKSPEERLRIAFQLNRFARQRIALDLHVQHPDWTDEQVRSELVRRMLGGAA